MSNRLRDAGALPLVMDPMLAVKLGQAVYASRKRAEQTVELGQAFVAVFRDIGHAIGWIGRSINRATEMRDLYSLTDRQLADIGIERGQIPSLWREARVNVATRPTSDRER